MSDEEKRKVAFIDSYVAARLARWRDPNIRAHDCWAWCIKDAEDYWLEYLKVTGAYSE